MISNSVSDTNQILTDPIGTNNDLVLDSGCSEHMFNSSRQLTDFVFFAPNERFVSVANGSKVPVIGWGKCGILRVVYYVPRLSHSLLSVSSLTKDGIKVLFQDDFAIIVPSNSGISFEPIRAKKINNLYKISQLQFELCTKIPHVYCLAHQPIGTELSECNMAEDLRTDSISTFHYMFGHPSAERTRYLCKCYNLLNIRKLEQKAFEFLKNCNYCRQAKGKRNSFSGTVARPQYIGKQWSADIKGPFQMPSLVNENIYVFGIIESKTRYLIQFYIKKKSDVGKCLRIWYDKYIRALRLSPWSNELTHIFLNTDMGESTSTDIITFLQSVGIQLTSSCPHTPEQNMIIERVWRTIGESAIAMLLTADLSEPYWEEARKTACYLYNRAPGAHTDQHPTSPYEQYYGVVPHVQHLKVFGSVCYPTNLVRNKGNHEPKAWSGIFVGYQDQQLIGWRIYLPKSNEFIITAHASFEDMRAQSKTPAIRNNCTQPISPYSKEEMDLVSIGRIGHMSETKLVERVGETIGGTDMCDARSNQSFSDTSTYDSTNSGIGKYESNGKNGNVEISGMLGPPDKVPANCFIHGG